MMFLQEVAAVQALVRSPGPSQKWSAPPVAPRPPLPRTRCSSDAYLLVRTFPSPSPPRSLTIGVS